MKLISNAVCIFIVSRPFACPKAGLVQLKGFQVWGGGAERLECGARRWALPSGAAGTAGAVGKYCRPGHSSILSLGMAGMPPMGISCKM